MLSDGLCELAYILQMFHRGTMSGLAGMVSVLVLVHMWLSKSRLTVGTALLILPPGFYSVVR